jgi:PAS domain S-box-containing protein
LNLLSVGPLATSLLCLYLGFYHLWFYRKVPALKENLYFSLSALAVGLYGFFCSMLYRTETTWLAVIWNRLQISSLILFCPAILYFVSTFVGRRIGRAHRFCLWLALTCAPATLFTDWVFRGETHTVHVPFPETVFIEGNPGPGAYVFATWVFVVVIYSTCLLLKGLRKGMHGVRPLLVACLMFYPMILNDLLVWLRFHQSIYLAEYGFLVIVLGLAVTLADRFFRVHGQVEALNESLREKSSEILASEKRYRALFEAAKDGIFLFNRAGQIRLANPYLRSLAGMPDSTNGLPNLRQLFRKNYTEIEEAMQALEEGSRERFEMEADLIPLSSPARSVSLAISLLERTPREALYQGIARDVTEQKEWMKKILHQDKMSSLGVLAGGVSHEFNNFLASISGFAQLAQIARKPEDVQRATAIIIEQAERATQVTQNLLRFAGSAKGTPREEIELSALLDRSLMLVEKDVEKARIRIVRDYADAPAIESTPISLEQVLVNLYLNARDAMESGGTMTVKAKARGEFCAIEVEDQGPGIPEEDLHRIFEPFYTTKGAIGRGRQKGLGLGLAISHGLVKELGGEIRAENLPEGGTRFTILLPLS